MDFYKVDLYSILIIRGYFDGDGSFYVNIEKRHTKKGLQIYSKLVSSLRGSEYFLKTYNSVLNDNIDIQSIVKPKLNNGIFQITHSGNIQVQKIVSFLYKNANIFMDRKYQIVKEVIQ